MKFKSKVSKMGKKKIINVPESIRDYLKVGTKVEVKIDKENKRTS